MAAEADWVPPGTDTKRANVARVYDYLLGGTHNFLADQDVARTIIAVEPGARAAAPRAPGGGAGTGGERPAGRRAGRGGRSRAAGAPGPADVELMLPHESP